MKTPVFPACWPTSPICEKTGYSWSCFPGSEKLKKTQRFTRFFFKYSQGLVKFFRHLGSIADKQLWTQVLCLFLESQGALPCAPSATVVTLRSLLITLPSHSSPLGFRDTGLIMPVKQFNGTLCQRNADGRLISFNSAVMGKLPFNMNTWMESYQEERARMFAVSECEITSRRQRGGTWGYTD